MEASGDLVGTLARLPDGQLVKIEELHNDGYVTVLRIEGDEEGAIAVCAAAKLQPVDKSKTE